MDGWKRRSLWDFSCEHELRLLLQVDICGLTMLYTRFGEVALCISLFLFCPSCPHLPVTCIVFHIKKSGGYLVDDRKSRIRLRHFWGRGNLTSLPFTDVFWVLCSSKKLRSDLIYRHSQCSLSFCISSSKDPSFDQWVRLTFQQISRLTLKTSLLSFHFILI